MNRRRTTSISHRLIAVAIVSVAGSATASVAEAAPNDHASCLAKLSVFNAEYPEVFGSRADVAKDIKAETEAVGLAPGAYLSMIAQRSTPIEDCA